MLETINVTLAVKSSDRFPGREAYEAYISEGPEWMRHQTETASTRGAAYGWLAERLVNLYSHRAALCISRG
jgi:hypothetical protein